LSADLKQQWGRLRLDHWLVEEWIRALSDLMGTLDDDESQPPGWQAVEPDSWKEWREPSWYEIGFDIASGAALRIGFEAAARESIARSLFGGETEEAADGEAAEGDDEEAFGELLQQAADGFAAAVSERLGREISVTGFEPADAPPNADFGVDVERREEGQSERFGLWFNPLLLSKAIGPPDPEDEDEDEGEDENDADRKSLANLKLLLDVELDLSVSFGHTELELEEVLKLASGSIVELNRSANDPVAILVNGSVVAYGDVVVVDGNYGIRITEISSKKERISSIL